MSGRQKKRENTKDLTFEICETKQSTAVLEI